MPSGENEGQLAALDLLVLAHRSQDISRLRLKAGNLAHAGRKADRPQMRLDPRGVLPRAQTKVARETERRGHADGDALAVHEPRRIIVGQILQGMAKGMPKIEQRALSLLRLVGDDDARLGRAADRDRFGAGRPAGEYVAPIRFQKLEKAAVANEPILDDFRESRRENRARSSESRQMVSASTSDG